MASVFSTSPPVHSTTSQQRFGGFSFNGNFQGGFQPIIFLSFFGAKLQIWGDIFFLGGLESYDGASVGCWVILRMSRNTADQFIGLAWTCPPNKFSQCDGCLKVLQ